MERVKYSFADALELIRQSRDELTQPYPQL